MEQREAFTKDFFDALGAKKVSELTGSGIGEIETILTAITTQSEGKTKIVFGKFLASAFHAFLRIDYKQLLKTGTAIQGIVCLLIGLFFMMAPVFATRSIGLGLGLAALFWLGSVCFLTRFPKMPIQAGKSTSCFFIWLLCVWSPSSSPNPA